mgnify:CR=1 FL=1
MPSTSLFFPKRLQGTALAIQAGVGNFGVSIVQFITPWIIGFALFGGLVLDYLRRLATTGAAYTASSVFSKLIAVFLLPVYTAYLTPADYGAAEVMLASVIYVRSTRHEVRG